MASRGLGLARQNLEGADLSNHSWQGVNFNYANLKGANFTGADLTRATLRYADLTGANFTGADMTGTDMTGAETKSAIFKDLSKLNWIDRELALTGELPRLPNWMFPPLMEDVFVNGSDKGDRVEKGQDFWIERGDWCDLSPTQRLMIEEYIIWQGYKFQDWLEEPPSIGLVYDRCPPAEGY